jgi:ribosomal protein S18 acetylase RimI-like enzyme
MWPASASEPADGALLLRRCLKEPLRRPLWPAHSGWASLTAGNAEQAYRLLLGCGAELAPCEEWFARFTRDPDYDPTLCLVAYDEHGLVGVAHGWTSAFIKDLAVAPRARRRGIATRLLAQLACCYQQRGEGWVDLKVRQSNHPARQLYARSGFRVVTGYTL